MRNYITRAWTGGRDYCYVEPNLPEKKEGMVLNMLGGLHFQHSPSSERRLLLFAMLPECMILVLRHMHASTGRDLEMAGTQPKIHLSIGTLCPMTVCARYSIRP